MSPQPERRLTPEQKAEIRVAVTEATNEFLAGAHPLCEALRDRADHLRDMACERLIEQVES